MLTLGLCLVTLQLMNVGFLEAAYMFEVKIHSYSNPENRTASGNCCDFPCENACDSIFDGFCLRHALHSHDNVSFCPLGHATTKVIGLPAAIAMYGIEPWPGSFQLYIRVMDDDPLANDLIDTIFAESFLDPQETSPSTIQPFVGSFQRATLGLSFKMSCQAGYTGANCSTFCQQVDSSLGHYIRCTSDDGNSTVECLNGYTNVTSNCTLSTGSGITYGGLAGGGVVLFCVSVAVLFLYCVTSKKRKRKHLNLQESLIMRSISVRSHNSDDEGKRPFRHASFSHPRPPIRPRPRFSSLSTDFRDHVENRSPQPRLGTGVPLATPPALIPETVAELSDGDDDNDRDVFKSPEPPTGPLREISHSHVDESQSQTESQNSENHIDSVSEQSSMATSSAQLVDGRLTTLTSVDSS